MDSESMRIAETSRRRIVLCTVAPFAVSQFALGEDAACHTFSCTPWTWPAYIIVPIVLTAFLYLIGILKMSRRQRRLGLPLFAVLSFTLGLVSLIIALDSPMHEIGEQLFWVHMTQHEVLMLISAPLLVLGRPLLPFLWALPNRWRNFVAEVSRSRAFGKSWNALSAPLTVWLLSAFALLIWHAPPLFDKTLRSDSVHAAQHISFLGTALLFWWTLTAHSRRLGYGAALLYVFTTAIYTSVLGALLALSPHLWYSSYAESSQLWGLTPLEDQQIGGLIMWVPGGTVLLIVCLVLLVRWMRESQRRWQYTGTAALMRLAALERNNL